MPIRWFQTDEGVTWQVWNVMPGRSAIPDRRIGYDRRSPDPVIRHTGPDRRAPADRRRPPPFLSADLATGWLAFECPTEKRRLTPIPQKWEELSDAELRRLCDQARPVAPIVPRGLPPVP